MIFFAKNDKYFLIISRRHFSYILISMQAQSNVCETVRHLNKYKKFFPAIAQLNNNTKNLLADGNIQQVLLFIVLISFNITSDLF